MVDFGGSEEGVQEMGFPAGAWGLESCARCAGFSMAEIARSACAFAKRARLPQAEDSAPMRVSRMNSPQAGFRAAALTYFKIQET